MSRLLEVNGLALSYHTHMGPLKALRDVNFHIDRGEILGIVGESGCGKSTVASALLRLLPPNGEITDGQLRFQERDLLQLNAEELRELRGHDISMIFQDPMTSLNPVFTIGEQMVDVQRAHLRGRQISSAELRQRAIAMLERVGMPDPAERFDLYPHQFSGGMRQRIMIAMALLSEPALLVADEPTSALDVTLEAQILELIKGLRDDYGTAVLYISHDLGSVAQLCDRVVVMYAGSVVEHGTVDKVFNRAEHPYTRALLESIPSHRRHGEPLTAIPGLVPSLAALPSGCKFADRCALARPHCQAEEPRYLTVEGADVRCHIYDPGSPYHQQGEPTASPTPEQEIVVPESATGGDLQVAANGNRSGNLFELKELEVYFHDGGSLLQQLLNQPRSAVRAVDGVDLDIAHGEVIGLVGESGSGKTTLGKSILRLIKPTGGQLFFDGQDISRSDASTLRRLRRQMQMIFQDPYSSLSPRLRVSYLLTEPYIIHGVPKEERRSVSELLAMVGLSDEQASKFPHELSGGQARRVGIARALALEPRFLVADEPTAGLDVSAAASVLNLMKELADRLALTYLIITHNLHLVGYIADRVAVMYLGKLVEVGPTHQVLTAPRHPYTMALLAATAEVAPGQHDDRERLLLEGEIPSPKRPPSGCRFHTRCPFVQARCVAETPIMEPTAAGHTVACHFWRDIAEQGGKSTRKLPSRLVPTGDMKMP